ncbi:hypothetical protein K435DRAFT_873390 [Dendrothele bispora CBS 962.96]|uniref:Uncharacterized protein n=1 Tax=Dendrothele bispora (strain CBS 962.96) TaxID=1314807 RepID=A0A4S8KZ94_DENBC|nr:hypothetical protein K435DRAFT_873390 [Dendrothele bispora CBS 962.96]
MNHQGFYDFDQIEQVVSVNTPTSTASPNVPVGFSTFPSYPNYIDSERLGESGSNRDEAAGNDRSSLTIYEHDLDIQPKLEDVASSMDTMDINHPGNFISQQMVPQNLPSLTIPESRPQEQPFFSSMSASPLQDVKPSITPSLTFQPHPPFSFQSPLSPMKLWERDSFIPQQQHQECITNSSRTQNFSYQLNGQSITPLMLGQASSGSVSNTPYQQLPPSTAPWKKENDATSPIGIYPQQNAWSGNLFNRDNADWKSFGDGQTSNTFGGDSDYVAVPIHTAAIPQTEPAVIREKIASQALIDVATRRRQNPSQKLYRCDRCSQDFTAKHNLRSNSIFD